VFVVSEMSIGKCLTLDTFIGICSFKFINSKNGQVYKFSAIRVNKCLCTLTLRFIQSSVRLIKDLEKVQIRAANLVIALKHLRYKQRLERLKLPTLRFRRTRGDMIESAKF